VGGASVGRGRGKGTGFLTSCGIRISLRILCPVGFFTSGRCLRAETDGALSTIVNVIAARAAHFSRHVIISGSARPGSRRSGGQCRYRNSPRLFGLTHTVIVRLHCVGTHARRDRSNATRHAMLSFRSPLPTTSLVRCDNTPQKIGEAIGNSFLQDVAIMVTKAFADLDESFSLEFFCLISL
jgi:hypothetical protein